ncbi:hypothetical protein A374_18524 [Fictibacillus macauensis ZFHKF-1]|uniref:DUF4440 domain-containing protein n=1 Tax=Fictibacillus macauensis ZFHKF-1 TaxID=1196324 RepID=I8IWH3_9BACL|nr:DUF4440 domain-containing protein [Fictibacillus macauensis]EIT83851.1 hypothetical protein A374_18524 [Fictibacillus macauensis ZFHKF-1]
MEPTLKDHLQALEESHLKIDVRKNSTKLAELLADTFFEIGSSGYRYDKKDCLETGVVLTEMSLHNYEIHLLASDVVLATYFIVDRTRSRNTFRSSIWKVIDDRWQLYFHQGTITPLLLREVLAETGKQNPL